MEKIILLALLLSLFALLLTCAPISETQTPLCAVGGKEVEKEVTNLSKINPTLAEELRRLPELRSGLNERGVLALNRIVTFYTQSSKSDEVKQIFDRILSIGKKEHRKFSGPLQALFWLAEGEELSLNENPLKRYSQEKYWGFNKNLGEDEEVITFVYNIWKGTYDTDKWEDPSEIIDRLNSPHLLDLFFRDNIAYDFDKREKMQTDRDYHRYWAHYVQSAKVTIKRRKGTCSDATNLAYEVLGKAGYNVKPLKVVFVHPTALGNLRPSDRHHVAVLKQDGLFYKIADDTYVKEGIIGPFKSIMEIGDVVAKSRHTLMKEYSLSLAPIR